MEAVGRRTSHSRSDVFGVAIIAALIAFALAFGAQRGRRAVPVAARAGDASVLVGQAARYTFFPTSGRIDVASSDTRSRIDLELSLLVDGVERPLVMRRGDVHLKDKSTLSSEFPIEMGEERATGSLELRMDPSTDLLTVSLSVLHEAGSSNHTYALRAGFAPEGRAIFIPGTGEVAEFASVESKTIVVDDDQHPFALLSTQGALAISETPPETEQPGARPRVVISARAESVAKRAQGAAPGKAARLDLAVLVGQSSQQIWGRLYKLLRVPVARVSGQVTGTKEHAHILALDEEGHPQVRAMVDPQGKFAVDAPMTAVQWYAALEAVHTSAPVRFTPGTQWELKLDVSAGGELAVKAIDADSGKPLVARLIVKGVEGTLDPTFGPDYRATGAGPLMDIMDGEVTTPLPTGKYRVSVTKGIEWTIDSEIVEVTSAHTKQVDLALRHVVPTPGMVGCDLHVHARPSFDSPVTPEDRVLSLVSAGVDFAVPTEHNMVGDYTPALEVMRLTKHLAHVPGVEVTTYNPRFGHFGVFPYPLNAGVPPYRGTNAGAVIAGSRRGDPNRLVQINHPRLPSGIGYFQVAGYDPKAGRAPGMRLDFDTIEIYNGYDIANRPRVDEVLQDWFAILNHGKHLAATGSSDSHRIQYQWAGYPRTYALVDPKAAGDTGQPIDTKEVVAALKKGKSFVSSGPIIELELNEGGRVARPGDEIPPPKSGTIGGRVKVRAPPWLDVASIEIIVGAPPPAQPGAALVVPPTAVQSIFKKTITSPPTTMGKEEGRLDEIVNRAVRFEQELSLKLPDNTRWIIVMVRGERTMDDALPFMAVQPLAFTNPIYIAVPKAPKE